jgi:hypothetical protein
VKKGEDSMIDKKPCPFDKGFFGGSAMKHTPLTLMILHLNSVLDSGKYDGITVEEVKDHIDDRSILPWLRQRAPELEDELREILDTDLYGDFEEFYVGQLQDILGGYGGRERRKWGVEKKGLCLLIAWTNEIVQRGSGWRPDANLDHRWN